jgi:hypothetical protein
MQTQQLAKPAADGVASVVTVAGLIGWLPHISAMLGIVWFGIQITEKLTGRPFAEIVRCVYRRLRGCA